MLRRDLCGHLGLVTVGCAHGVATVFRGMVGMLAGLGLEPFLVGEGTVVVPYVQTLVTLSLFFQGHSQPGEG